MFTTALFDLDGTLLDTLQDLAAAGNHTLQTLGHPPHPVESYRTMVGNGVPKLIERMLPPKARSEKKQAQALGIFRTYYAQHMQDLTAPYPGVLCMLAQLHAEGVAVGVVSNKADEFVQPIVRQYFPQLVNAAVGLRDGVPPKPDPASVHTVMRTLGADAAATLYCGDSDVDMHTATAAGVQGCGVLWGFRTRAELAGAGASFLAGDVPALTQLILTGRLP